MSEDSNPGMELVAALVGIQNKNAQVFAHVSYTSVHPLVSQLFPPLFWTLHSYFMQYNHIATNHY